MGESDTRKAIRLRERIAALKQAADIRRSLPVGTAEYEAAFDEEMRLDSKLRELVDEESGD